MEIKILNESKNELELEINNLTLVELLRSYLNLDSGVVFVAWRREHYTKNPILKIETKGKTAKKAVNEALNRILKELDKVENDFKKLN